MNIQTAISALLDYAERVELIKSEDRFYFGNLIIEALKLDTLERSDLYYTGGPEVLLKAICDYAFEVGLIEVMGLAVLPSRLNIENVNAK